VHRGFRGLPLRRKAFRLFWVVGMWLSGWGFRGLPLSLSHLWELLLEDQCQALLDTRSRSCRVLGIPPDLDVALLLVVPDVESARLVADGLPHTSLLADGKAERVLGVASRRDAGVHDTRDVRRRRVDTRSRSPRDRHLDRLESAELERNGVIHGRHFAFGCCC